MGGPSRSRLLLVAALAWGWAGTALAGPVADGIILDGGGDVTAQLVFSKANFRDAVRIYRNGTLVAQPPCGFMQAQGGGSALSDCVFENTQCITGANACQATSSGELNCTCQTALQVDLGTMNAGDKLTFEVYADSSTPADGVPEYVWSSDVTKNSDNPFPHVRMSTIYANTYLTEFEDLPSNVSDQDYNDMVLVIQVAPNCPSGSPGCTNTGFIPAVPGGPQDVRSVTNIVVKPGTGAGDPNRNIEFHTKLYNFDTVGQKIAYCATQTIPGTVTNPGDGTVKEVIQGFNYTDHDRNVVLESDGGPTCYIQDSGAVAISFSQENAPAPASYCDINTGAGEPAGAISDLYDLKPATGNPLQPTSIDITTTMTVGQIDQAIVDPSNKLTPLGSDQIRAAMYNTTNMLAKGITATLLFGIDPILVNGATKFSCPRGGNTELLLGGVPMGSAGDLGGGAGGPVFGHYAPPVQTYPAVIAINSPATVTIPTNPVEARGTAGILSTIDYTWTDNRPDLEPGKPHLLGHITQAPIGLGGEFLAGGSGTLAVQTTLAFNSQLPEGFEGTLTAVLHSVYDGKIFQVSTFHFSKDHAPPTIDSFHTERRQDRVDVTGVVEDQLSGIGQVELAPTINASSQPSQVMSYVSGDFSGATTYRASVAAAASDVVGIAAKADDTHFNATTATLPVASTGGDRQIECDSPSGAQVTLDGSGSTGPSGTSYVWSGPFGSAAGVTVSEPLPFGASQVTLSLTDPTATLTGSQTSTLTVGDSTPPALSVSASPTCIWPANHKLVLFTLGSDLAYSVQDACDPNPTVEIVNVTDTDGSAVAFGPHHACLRAERSGADTGGNVYTVTIRATDAHGNAATRDVTVTVPHDRSSGCPGTPPGRVVSDGDPRCTQ